MNEMRISIIICTKNRSENLKDCLKSISFSSVSYDELIVIDSSTTDSVKKINEQLTQCYGGNYIFEGGSGLSIARNTGIRYSSYDLLIFADDDFLVESDWIEKLMKNYDDPKVMCCTGRMLPYRNDEISQLLEKTMSFDRGNKKQVFTKNDISILILIKLSAARLLSMISRDQIVKGNPVPWSVGFGFCSFRKNIFSQVGNFDTNLGIGTNSLGGEEIDIFYRILKAGYTIIYEPEAIILHNHRATIEGALRAAYNAGASVRSFTKKYYKQDRYLLCCFVGAIGLTALAFTRSLINFNKEQREMVAQQMRGLFHNSGWDI